MSEETQAQDPLDETPEAEAPAAEAAPEQPDAPEPAPQEDPAARIAALEAQVRELDDNWRRAVAEMENVRRRADIQIEQGRKFAIADFAKAMLEVADNLSRALDHVPEQARTEDEAVKALFEGVDMTGKSLLQVLERFGVKPVPAEGQRFDPKFHEAMFEVPLPDQPSGMVVQVMETGFMIADRLLRPARVGVSKGGPKPEPVTSAEEAAASGGAKAYDKVIDGTTRASGSQVNEEL
ncbi:hypothetical protein JCM17960_12900 [Magnetospira thiophila]